MYYRRPVHGFSGLYRALSTRRFILTTMGGYWPVIQQLPDGHPGVVTRDGDIVTVYYSDQLVLPHRPGNETIGIHA